MPNNFNNLIKHYIASQRLLFSSFSKLSLKMTSTDVIKSIIITVRMTKLINFTTLFLYFLPMVLIAGEICTDDYMASQRLLFPSLNIRMIKMINFTSLTEAAPHFLSMVLIAGKITTEPYMASQRLLSPPIMYYLCERQAIT